MARWGILWGMREGSTAVDVVITAKLVGGHYVLRCGCFAGGSHLHECANHVRRRALVEDDDNANSDIDDAGLVAMDYYLALRGASIGLLECAIPPLPALHQEHTGGRKLQSEWTRPLVVSGLPRIRALNVAHGWQASRVCLPSGESLSDVPGCEPRAVFRYTMTREQLATVAQVGQTDRAIIRKAHAGDYAPWRSSFRKYRPTQIPDAPDLLEDELEGAFSHFATHDWRRAGLLLACEEDSGELMGMAQLSMFENAAGRGPGWCYLKDLWVEPAARRRRVGRALVGAAAAWALERDATGLRWFCIKSNAAAVAFYERLGATRDCDNCWHINTEETVAREHRDPRVELVAGAHV